MHCPKGFCDKCFKTRCIDSNSIFFFFWTSYNIFIEFFWTSYNIFIEFFNILLCVSFKKSVPLGSTVTIVKRIVALTVEFLGYVPEKLEVVRMHVKVDGKEPNVSEVSLFELLN